MREKIELNDSFANIVMKMSEGNMGATNVVSKMLSLSPESFMLLLDLDDMNIRGTQIWLAYKDYCAESIDLFVEAVKKRDDDFVEAVNILAAKQGTWFKAVRYGASNERNFPMMTPEEMKNFAKKDVPVNPKVSQMG